MMKGPDSTAVSLHRHHLKGARDAALLSSGRATGRPWHGRLARHEAWHHRAARGARHLDLRAAQGAGVRHHRAAVPRHHRGAPGLGRGTPRGHRAPWRAWDLQRQLQSGHRAPVALQRLSRRLRLHRRCARPPGGLEAAPQLGHTSRGQTQRRRPAHFRPIALAPCHQPCLESKSLDNLSGSPVHPALPSHFTCCHAHPAPVRHPIATLYAFHHRSKKLSDAERLSG